MSEKTARDVAIERQGQFERYLTVLAFAVLGLAIQTSKLGVTYVADASELLGWCALLTSALCGLKRLEQTPEHYRLQDMRNQQREKHLKSEEILLTQPHAIFEVLAEGPKSGRQFADEVKADIPRIEKRLKEVDAHLIRLYRVQRAGLVSGLVLLGIARATPAIAHVLRGLGYVLH